MLAIFGTQCIEQSSIINNIPVQEGNELFHVNNVGFPTYDPREGLGPDTLELMGEGVRVEMCIKAAFLVYFQFMAGVALAILMSFASYHLVHGSGWSWRVVLGLLGGVVCAALLWWSRRWEKCPKRESSDSLQLIGLPAKPAYELGILNAK